MSGPRTRLLSSVADQLARPHGLLGKGFARLLNRGNRRGITAAVEAALTPRARTAADIGFGGDIGLSLLLSRLGPDATVHGIELSTDMLARARSIFSTEITTGRLRLTEGSLTSLPLPDASLDAAITVNTVYFVEDLDAVAAELFRVLRLGGRAVVLIGDPEAMAKMPFTAYRFTLRPVAEVIAALERAGCTVEHRTDTRPPIPAHLLIAQRGTT